MLQVLPNPYRVLDANGKPTAVVPCHPRHAPGEFVGATKSLIVASKEDEAKFIDIKRMVGGRQVIEKTLAQFDRSKASFEFSTEPVQVPAEGPVGAYYRDRVREGSLLPADRATAQKCGVPFESAEKAVAKERNAAADEFKRQFAALPEWANDTKPAPAVAPK
jgi:hypothetical protein